MFSTNNEILKYCIYLLLTIKGKMYKNILLNCDGPVFCYLGGHKADGCKRSCLLALANLFFTPVYSTGPSSVSEDVQ